MIKVILLLLLAINFLTFCQGAPRPYKKIAGSCYNGGTGPQGTGGCLWDDYIDANGVVYCDRLEWKEKWNLGETTCKGWNKWKTGNVQRKALAEPRLVPAGPARGPPSNSQQQFEITQSGNSWNSGNSQQQAPLQLEDVFNQFTQAGNSWNSGSSQQQAVNQAVNAGLGAITGLFG